MTTASRVKSPMAVTASCSNKPTFRLSVDCDEDTEAEHKYNRLMYAHDHGSKKLNLKLLKNVTKVTKNGKSCRMYHLVTMHIDTDRQTDRQCHRCDADIAFADRRRRG